MCGVFVGGGKTKNHKFYEKEVSYLLRTPPNNEAFKHSGGDNLRWTSPTVTLYFDVELSNERRPGTLQNTSEGVVDIPENIPINEYLKNGKTIANTSGRVYPGTRSIFPTRT